MFKGNEKLNLPSKGFLRLKRIVSVNFKSIFDAITYKKQTTKVSDFFYIGSIHQFVYTCLPA